MKPSNCNCPYADELRDLKQQRDELMEWQNSAKLIIEHFITDTHHYEMNASLIMEAEELIQKAL